MAEIVKQSVYEYVPDEPHERLIDPEPCLDEPEYQAACARSEHDSQLLYEQDGSAIVGCFIALLFTAACVGAGLLCWYLWRLL